MVSSNAYDFFCNPSPSPSRFSFRICMFFSYSDCLHHSSPFIPRLDVTATHSRRRNRTSLRFVVWAAGKDLLSSSLDDSSRDREAGGLLKVEIDLTCGLTAFIDTPKWLLACVTLKKIDFIKLARR